MLECLQPYAGVDMSWAEKGNALHWDRCNSMAMGLVSSPFVATGIFSWSMEVITADKKRSSNIFFWDFVIQNSHGTTSYDHTIPVIYIWDSIQGVISAARKMYVDDLISIAANQSLAKEATHQVETTTRYIGLQDANRKWRPISQTPGEWNGSITLLIEGVFVFITVSEKKWNK